MRIRLSLILIFVFYIVSCNYTENDQNNPKNTEIPSSIVEVPVPPREETPKDTMPKAIKSKGFFIGSKEISVSFPSVNVISRISKINEDRNNQEVILSPYTDIADILTVVVDSKLKDLKIEQQYENSIILKNGEQIHVLKDWKHHATEWEEVINKGENHYKTIYPDEEDLLKVPKFTLNEITAYLQNQGLDNWAKHIRNSQENYEDDPIWTTGISTVKIRFSGINGKGEKFQKVVNMRVPIE